MQKREALLAVGAVLVGGVLGVAWLRQAEAPAPAAPASDSSWQAPIGPGTMSSNVRLPQLADDTVVPEGLGVDASGHLLVNLPLRLVFDTFLAGDAAPTLAARAQSLRTYLNGRLPDAARKEADALLTSYLAYIAAHDMQLARQQLDLKPDVALTLQQVERLASWQNQRQRLRQASFGIALAQTWFGADEAQLTQALAELRQRLGGAAASDDNESESNRLRAQRMHNVSQDEARNAIMGEQITTAVTPYAARKPH